MPKSPPTARRVRHGALLPRKRTASPRTWGGRARKRRGATRESAPDAGTKAVDAYLRAVAPKWRGLLTQMRRTIREAAPEAREGISYRIPTFYRRGNLVHFAAFEDHASFFPGSGRAREKFSRELRSFPGTKGSIHVTSEHPLPLALVKRIVRWRVRENERR